MRSASAAVLALLLGATQVRASKHDYFQRRTEIHHSPQAYGERQSGGSRDGERRLESSGDACQAAIAANPAWGPFRIGFEVVDSTGSAAKISRVTEVMRRATAYIRSLLQVRQVSGPLMLDRSGEFVVYTGSDRLHYTSASSPVCGPDEFRVPDKYLKAARACSKICPPGKSCKSGCVVGTGRAATCACNYTAWSPDIQGHCCGVPTSNPCQSDPDFEGKCTTEAAYDPGVLSLFPLPDDQVYELCQARCTDFPAGAGAVDEDLHVFVRIADTEACLSPMGTTQAYASSCAKDQCDRPVFAYINWCERAVDLSVSALPAQVVTAIHELLHALGFSSAWYRYFRRTDGTPRLPREANGLNTQRIRYHCFDNTLSFPDARGSETYTDLTGTIITSVNERGIGGQCGCPYNTTTLTPRMCIPRKVGDLLTPSCTVKVQLPTVLEKVREHFDCPTLEGAELENQDTSPCDWVGSHWEGRIFEDELMVAVMTANAPRLVYLSNVTLALLEDSGWYRVDWSRGDRLVSGAHWGYKRGCAFARDRCISNGKTTWDRVYCTSNLSRACNLGRTGITACLAFRRNLGNSTAFDYFNGSGHVGTRAQSDYCPVYSAIIMNRVCINPTSEAVREHEVFGQNSRCLEGDLRPARLPDTAATPLCYNINCTSSSSFTVSILVDGMLTVAGKCDSEGQEITVPGMAGRIRCAHPREFCQLQPPSWLAGLDVAGLPEQYRVPDGRYNASSVPTTVSDARRSASAASVVACLGLLSTLGVAALGR